MRAFLYYYYYLLLFEFFIPVLVDGLSLEIEWQQVTSSLLASSLYSSRSQQCCSLDGLHSFSYFQVLQSLYQSFGDFTKSTNYNWYSRFFNSLSRLRYLFFFIFFLFYSTVSRDSKVHNFASSLFLNIVIRSGRLDEITWSVCMSKSPRSLYVSFSKTDARLCIYQLFVW